MWFIALCVLVFLVNGYHPHSGEAEHFVASVEWQINPSLHPDAAFQDSQDSDLWFPVISRILAVAVVNLHLPLGFLLLTLYLTSIAAFLLACNLLAERMFHSKWARSGAILLAAACFAIPVAGISLHLMEPYITPRSIAIPLSLFSVVACLDRSWKRAVACLLLAAVACPIESAYFAIFLVVLALIDSSRHIAAIAICASVIGACILLSYRTGNTSVYSLDEGVIFHQITSCAYGIQQFVFGSRLYGLVQLVAPLILLAFIPLQFGPETKAGKLSRSCVLIGITTCIVLIVFAHPGHSGIPVSSWTLQCFETVDAVAVVLLGGLLFSFFLERGIWIGISLIVMVFGSMFLLGRRAYSNQPHIETYLAFVADHTVAAAVSPETQVIDGKRHSNLPI